VRWLDDLADKRIVMLSFEKTGAGRATVYCMSCLDVLPLVAVQVRAVRDRDATPEGGFPRAQEGTGD
jgi:hypothetical protein